MLAVVLALAIGSSRSLTAHTATTGVVLGKVTDPSGALVAGAEVLLTDTTTNLVLRQRTNDAGQFTFAGMPPGASTHRHRLLTLQPTTTPGTFATGGPVSGARSDQNSLLLDKIDVSDNLTGGQGATFTQAPVGVDGTSDRCTQIGEQPLFRPAGLRKS